MNRLLYSIISLLWLVLSSPVVLAAAVDEHHDGGIEKETIFYGFKRIGDRIVGTNDHLRTHRKPRKRRRPEEPLTGAEVFDMLITQEARDRIDAMDWQRGMRWTMPDEAAEREQQETTTTTNQKNDDAVNASEARDGAVMKNDE